MFILHEHRTCRILYRYPSVLSVHALALLQSAVDARSVAPRMRGTFNPIMAAKRKASPASAPAAIPATANITSMLHEERVFPPPKEFARQAHIKSFADYQRMYRESVRDPEKFWAREAKKELVW